MAKIIRHTFLIAVATTTGVPVYSDNLELPSDLSPDCLASAQYLLTDLTGGTAPTVGVELQVSNDGNNWADLHPIWSTTAPVLAAEGDGFLMPGSGAGRPDFDGIATVRYVRLKGTPGGTVVPETWNLSVFFNLKTG